MNTPETNQFGIPVSEFEDSLIFHYISNLSPIKPVEPLHIAQTFNSLAFAVPSVFTSPHLSSHKECGILRRHHLSDLSKPDVSGNGYKVNRLNTSAGVLDSVQLHNRSSSQESFDPGYSITEVTVPFNEPPNLAIELPRNLKYDFGGPDCNTMPSHGINTDLLPEIGPPASPVCFVQEVSEGRQHLFESNVQIQGICQVDQNKEEGAGCDWENFVSDASDLLIFDTSIEAESSKERILDLGHHEIGFIASPGSKVPHDSNDDLQMTQPMGLADPCEEYQVEDTESRSEAVMKHKEINKTLHVSSSSFSSEQMNSDPNEGNDEAVEKYIPVSVKPDSEFQNVVRRRCLVFEMAGAQKENLGDDFKNSSSISSHSDDKQVVLIKPGNTSSPRMLPDASQESKFGGSEEFNLSSAKKKRKLENVGESEACKRCNCRKSKCLKLYCECFAAGVYCIEPCSCQECFNKPIHKDTVLATRKQIESRNPLAFTPKVIRSSEPVLEIGDDTNNTPSSARHKRGCNCKKSSCQKKYCECYQGGVGCSINCRCEGCKNAFGRKDGFVQLGTEEVELEKEQEETYENNGPDKILQNNEVQKYEEKYSDSDLPNTPAICRPPIPLRCSSSVKPPHSVLGSSFQLHSIRILGKSNVMKHRSMFGRHCETAPEDETLEILRGNSSPISSVKTVSPNRKRVSPPHNEFGMCPDRRPGLKLILQSIPSSPSLTTHHETGEFSLKFE